MEVCLGKYIGWTLEVHYVNYTTAVDRGILTAFEPGWIELTRNPRKAREETLLIPVSAIRLVKPIAQPDDEDQILLRPADVPEEQPVMAEE
jgi:hypothetical protein